MGYDDTPSDHTIPGLTGPNLPRFKGLCQNHKLEGTNLLIESVDEKFCTFYTDKKYLGPRTPHELFSLHFMMTPSLDLQTVTSNDSV